MSRKSTDNSKLYLCGLCEKAFTLKSNLSRHILTFHQNNYSYTCDQCEKRFHRRDSLIRHFRSHQRKKRCRKVPNSNPSNKCPICLVAFPTKRGLLHHSRTEHEPIIIDGSKKEYFECSECAMRVNNKKDIKRHINTVHSSDSQNESIKKVPSLRCAECGKDFRYRKTLMNHYREEHRIELRFKQFTFDTIDHFEGWKSPCYTMTNAWLTSVYSVKRFRCHRSGFYVDECEKTNRRRRRHLKLAGSKKIQATCPSEITLRRRHQGGRCFVTHQKTHVGHSVDDADELKHIRLRPDDKQNVARLLKAGVPAETILRSMYCEYEPTDVSHQQLESLPTDDDGESRLDREHLQVVLPTVSKRLRRLRQRHTAAEECADGEQLLLERPDDDGESRLDREHLQMVLPMVSKRLRRLRQRHTAAEEYAEGEQLLVERTDDDGESRLYREHLQVVLPTVSKRLRRLRQRHTAAEECAEGELLVERIDDDVWQVGLCDADSQGIVEMYVVQKCESGECSSQGCQLLCQPCRRCFHEYLCLCQDYSVAQNMCVHVHALCLFLLNQNQADDIVTLSVGADEVPYDVCDGLTAASGLSESSPLVPMLKIESDERNFEETVYEVLEDPSESIEQASSVESDIDEMNFEEIHVAPEIRLKSPLELPANLPSDGRRMNLKIVHVDAVRITREERYPKNEFYGDRVGDSRSYI